jgi:hypothetical protein
MRFVSDTRDQAAPAYTGGLKVIAAGLPRCATSSLQYALENELGFGPCMHMAYIAPHVSKLKLCNAAMAEKDKAKRHAILHQIFDGYQSTADFPGMSFVEDLVEMYPDAKVILNLRKNSAAWFKSISGTIQFFSTKQYHAITYLIPTDYWHYRVHQTFKEQTLARGINFSLFSEEYYHYHGSEIRRIAKKHDKELLEWEPSMGYSPICEFLEIENPKKDFPRLNDEAFMKKLRAFVIIRGVLAWAAVVVVAPVAAAWWTFKWLRT